MWLIAAMMTTALAWTSAPNANDWTIVNDTVMGGVSQATVTDHPQGGVVFSGTLSLANNGGFASLILTTQSCQNLPPRRNYQRIAVTRPPIMMRPHLRGGNHKTLGLDSPCA